MHIYINYIYPTDIKTLRQTSRETDERYHKAYKSHNTVETNMKSTTSDLLSETKQLKDKLLKVIYKKNKDNLFFPLEIEDAFKRSGLEQVISNSFTI